MIIEETPVSASHPTNPEAKDESRQITLEAVTESKSPQDVEPLFFKSSWMEFSYEKEFNIINTAHQRADEYLKGYSHMVTNHIPKVEAADACSPISTAKIRMIIKDAGGFEDFSEQYIEQHGRTKIYLVTHRLKPIERLPPDDFWKVFWDIVRCARSCFL